MVYFMPVSMETAIFFFLKKACFFKCVKYKAYFLSQGFLIFHPRHFRINHLVKSRVIIATLQKERKKNSAPYR